MSHPINWEKELLHCKRKMIIRTIDLYEAIVINYYNALKRTKPKTYLHENPVYSSHVIVLGIFMSRIVTCPNSQDCSTKTYLSHKHKTTMSHAHREFSIYYGFLG